MRISVFIVFMTMTMGVYAQKYKVGTTTALWKVPASTDFSQADVYKRQVYIFSYQFGYVF